MKWIRTMMLLGIGLIAANSRASDLPTAADFWKSRALVYGRLIRAESCDGNSILELEVLADIFGQLQLSREKKSHFVRVPTGRFSPVHIDVPAAPCNVLIMVWRPSGILQNEANKDTLWISFADGYIDDDIRLREVNRFPEDLVRDVLLKFRENTDKAN